MRVRPSDGRNSSSLILALSYVAIGASLGFMFKHYGSSTEVVKSSSKSRKPGKAWVLSVTFTFKEEADLNYVLESWKDVIEDCREKEPFLLHYEFGRLDSDPLKLHMLERYVSKDDYLQKHKNGAEFLKARPKLKALQDEGKVSIEGYSYQELGRGFA